MKRGLLLTAAMAAVLLLAACGGAAASPTPATVRITAPFGGFQIVSPTALKETSKSVESNVGTLEVTTFEGKAGGATYSVVYADYPETYAAVDPTAFLIAVRDEQVTALGGTLVTEGRTQMAGVAGREIQIRVELEDGSRAIHRSRLYWRPTRLYLVSVLIPEARANEAAVTGFLDSFELTDRAY